MPVTPDDDVVGGLSSPLAPEQSGGLTVEDTYNRFRCLNMRSQLEVERAWKVEGHDPIPADAPADKVTAVGRPDFLRDHYVWATPSNLKDRFEPAADQEDAFMEYVFRMLQLRRLPLIEDLATKDVGVCWGGVSLHFEGPCH